MAKLREVHTRSLSRIAGKRGISQSDSRIFRIPDRWDAWEKKNMYLLSLVGPDGKILGSSDMTISQNIFPFGPAKTQLLGSLSYDY